MADTKISALPAATTPLAGTEQLPIVQGGETRRIAASTLGGGAALHPGYVATYSAMSNWYTGWSAPANTNVYAINSTVFHPLILPVAASISRLSVYVNTGAAGATCRLAIYSNVAGKPSVRIIEAPTVDASSSGLKESVLGAPLNLAAGTYWLASHPSGFAAQYMGYGYGDEIVGHYIGFYYPWNRSAMGGLQDTVQVMPATASAENIGHSNGSGYIPAVFFKVA